ncbi:MAG: tRNA epoxyqueuosine(34) reductase QueG [Thermoanaerobaculales bacterium]|nr:tRNA epoxyqueuosine(34) reductase QueG [Thermoanaerobaculales bacterium]
MERSAALKDLALAEGFDLVGIAAAGPSATSVHLDAWLAAGRHGGMGYMAASADERSDPRRLLEGCRSLIMVGMSYRSSLPDSTDHPADRRVWVSRYAWGRDYHRLLKSRLLRLGRHLERRHPGCAWRAVVDTAPLLEREWAARAGLGWIGKSTMLLNRRLGSELFLGALLTDLELEPDRPVTDHCGRCTACLDACPTGAFREPYVLDARRCISYLTIEHRDEIPRELAPAMADMIAGCDRCNEVCPWTRRAPADLHPELAPAAHRHRPLLAELETLDEEGWRSWRRGSPLGRIPFPQLRRSLAVARANLEQRRPSDSDP